MKTTVAPPPDKALINRRPKTWFLTALALLIAIALTLGIVRVINAPRDLGPKLTYVGQDEVGCFWWQAILFLGLCSPGTTKNYYFATNMSQEELPLYFKKATYDNDRQSHVFGSDWRAVQMYFDLESNRSNYFILTYYDNTPAIIRKANLKQTDKKYIISLTEEDYKRAKESL